MSREAYNSLPNIGSRGSPGTRRLTELPTVDRSPSRDYQRGSPLGKHLFTISFTYSKKKIPPQTTHSQEPDMKGIKLELDDLMVFSTAKANTNQSVWLLSFFTHFPPTPLSTHDDRPNQLIFPYSTPTQVGFSPQTLFDFFTSPSLWVSRSLVSVFTLMNECWKILYNLSLPLTNE
jgi:hypothetical protein